MEMLRYSVPLIPNSIMWWVVGALNRPLMENYLGMYAVGIFGVANKFSGVLSMLFYMFSMSWQISVLEEFGKEGYGHFFNRMFRLVITGLLLLFFVITISSKFLIHIFTTEEFFEAWIYVPVLTLGVVFSGISGFVGCNFSATRESKYLFYSSIWGAITAIFCNILLIPKFGILGAAISVPISFAVMAVSRILYTWRYVKIKNIMRYVVMLAIGILMIIAVLYIKNTGLKSILIISLFIVFIGINYGLKEDVKNFYKKLNRSKDAA
ncbi:hypothetical protein FACS189461_4370 [Spirochaetia bacterium]|nr:hypothetical protein FACS189461_4370 [Spirochaetia bacterium]